MVEPRHHSAVRVLLAREGAADPPLGPQEAQGQARAGAAGAEGALAALSAVQEVAGEGDACLVVVTDKSHKVMHSAAEVVAMLRPFGGDLNLVER